MHSRNGELHSPEDKRNSSSLQGVLNALKACSFSGDVARGKKIHAMVLDNGDFSNMFVANTLVHMYAKCGLMPEARRVFDDMLQHNVISWSALIMGYAEYGQGETALEMYSRMQKEGCTPNHVTILAALKASGCLSTDTDRAAAIKSIHSQASRLDLISISVANSLLGAYTKCRQMLDAALIFQSMPKVRNVVCWNCMIMAYAQSGEADKALQLFWQMRESGSGGPDRSTLLSVLRACASLASKETRKVIHGKVMKLESLERGRAIHALASQEGLANEMSVENSLADMYFKCGSMAEAEKVIWAMSHISEVSWNCVIMGYTLNEEFEMALDMYARMQRECAPNALTLVAALRACAGLAEKKAADIKLKVKGLHIQASTTVHISNPLLAGTLVDAYGRLGSMGDALDVFESMPKRTNLAWCGIISGYAQSGQENQALSFFARMQAEECVPNDAILVAVLKSCSRLAEQEQDCINDYLTIVKGVEHSQASSYSNVVAAALVDAYAKCGSVLDAGRVFEGSHSKDVVLWNSIICVYCQNGSWEAILELYDRMQTKDSCLPDAVTVAAALKACASLGGKQEYVEKGIAIHEQARRSGLDKDMFVTNTLMSMYANFGNMATARRIFDGRVPDDANEKQAVISWNCIISGYASNGEAARALQLYWEMTRARRLVPVSSTFVAALKACATIAALETGRRIHSDVQRVLHGIPATNVANALINLYCKCGSMDEAERVFASTSASRDIVSWTTLMSGHSRQGHAQRVLELFERLLTEGRGLRPHGVMFLVILSACSHAGLAKEGEELFREMQPKYGVVPGIEHWNCMLDMFGRLGLFDRALETLDMMPFKPGDVSWVTILAASRKWKNVTVGKFAFDSILRLNTAAAAEASTFMLMSSIYSRAGMPEEAAAVHLMRRKVSNMKRGGYSCWIDREGVVHTFVTLDP